MILIYHYYTMSRLSLAFAAVFLIQRVNCHVVSEFDTMLAERDLEDVKANFIKDIVASIPNRKGWMNFMTMGDWSDEFYKKIQVVHRAFLVANEEYEGTEIDEQLLYKVNTLALKCLDLQDFENKLNVVREIPFWHPHTNTIVYYQKTDESKEVISKILFILWYYKICNAILVQYNDISHNFMVTHYNPYISEHFKLSRNFGCWTLKKIIYPIEDFEKSFVCTEGCHNMSARSTLRANHFGTCIGTETIIVSHNENSSHLGFTLFKDKTRNFHGFTMRAFVKEVIPFLKIDANSDGTYTLYGRDGFIWNTLSEIMNFTMDFSPSEAILKAPFDFEESINQIYTFAQRKGDLLLIPVYQFDLVIVQVDITTPFKASGVCFVSHRADFETTLFDVKLIHSNSSNLIQFFFCFLGTWFVFFIFNVVEKGTVSYSQAGKDLTNAFRNMLSVSLFKPPKKQSFRIFLGISIWSFFILNFASQAAIISFFSAHKRGKEVDTYDDVLEKGYKIEGMASPDVLLPDSEEKFRKINQKLVPVQDMFSCLDRMTNDSRRFCLIDCSVGRYFERNKLNEKGDQYLHVSKDKVHGHYLNWIFHKDSPMTDEFNRVMLIFLQAGLIDKWEQYRFDDLKYEAPIKALNMDDLGGIFKCFLFLSSLCLMSFVIEVSIEATKYSKQFFKVRYLKRKRTRAVRNYLKLERKRGKIIMTNNYTQT